MPFHLEVSPAVAQEEARKIGASKETTWRYGADMGEFAVLSGPHADRRLLMTMGAASCTIILVHKEPNVGALGHFATRGLDGGEIGKAVQQMIAVIGDSPTLKIVIAACTLDGELGARYHGEVRQALAARGDNAIFAWEGHGPTVPGGASACYYLPREEWACLFSDMPAGYKTAPEPWRNSGITSHEYKL